MLKSYQKDKDMSLIVVLFPLIALAVSAHASPEKATVNMLTSNVGAYTTEVRWKIENFLDMPYAKTRFNERGGLFFKSEPFPATSVNGVKWFFYVEHDGPATDDETSINLALNFQAPSTISEFSGTCHCAILGEEDTTSHKVELVEKVTASRSFQFDRFVKLKELRSNGNLLPNGHLILHCSVEGHLMLNMTSTNDVIPTLITESYSDWFCGSEIAKSNLDTFSQLLPYRPTLVTVKKDESGEFKETYYLINREILVKHVPALQKQFPYGRDYDWIVTRDTFQNKMQVFDFLTFVLKGDAENLKETCPQLYKVAKKYHFECLMYVCQTIMGNSWFPSSKYSNDKIPPKSHQIFH